MRRVSAVALWIRTKRHVGLCFVVVLSLGQLSQAEPLWDYTQINITNHSALIPGFDIRDMFGGDFGNIETGNVIFADGLPVGFDHFAEWTTAAPVEVGSIGLLAGGDGSRIREFDAFRLKTKSPGSSTFDLTLLDIDVANPYDFDPVVPIVLNAVDVPQLIAQEFRAEFTQLAESIRPPFNQGPRIVELMAFESPLDPHGPILSQPVYNPSTGNTYVLLDQEDWRASQSQAVSLGGDLVTINDESENDWVYAQFSVYGGVPRHLWIGLYDSDQSNNSADRSKRRGEFEWVSGEPVVYDNWSPHEPNNPNSGAPDHEFYTHIWYPLDPFARQWNNYINDRQELFDAPLNGVVEFAGRVAVPSIYVVKDNSSDSAFDDFGDTASAGMSKVRSPVGETDTANSNSVVRIASKFLLPEVTQATHALERATLRFFLEEVQGEPAGPVSLFHSVADNDLDQQPSDFEDSSYVDTLFDLVHPTDNGQQYYELDVTDLVLADYAVDGSYPVSAFRLQVNEAVFLEDDQSHRYRLTMPGAEANHPELLLTFIPEPSALLLCIIALGVFGGWRKWGR